MKFVKLNLNPAAAGFNLRVFRTERSARKADERRI